MQPIQNKIIKIRIRRQDLLAQIRILPKPKILETKSLNLFLIYNKDADADPWIRIHGNQCYSKKLKLTLLLSTYLMLLSSLLLSSLLDRMSSCQR